MNKKPKKVFGVGINDADYKVNKYLKIDGKWCRVWTCPYYQSWYSMLRRCYSEPFLKKRESYRGCSVHGDWIYFSNFKSWMETQDWEGKELDKDILIEGNRIYNPDCCRFVDFALNAFLTDHKAARGQYPLGACWHKATNKFQAKCSDPFTGKITHLGLFTCPNEAHLAWRKKKHEHACALADLQDDVDVAEALRSRFKTY